jgi:uncharacterized protein YbjQ (UPF0145 family)
VGGEIKDYAEMLASAQTMSGAPGIVAYGTVVKLRRK